MAAMGSIALLIYAAGAFALGWFFRGDHDRAKEAQRSNVNADDNR